MSSSATAWHEEERESVSHPAVRAHAKTWRSDEIAPAPSSPLRPSWHAPESQLTKKCAAGSTARIARSVGAKVRQWQRPRRSCSPLRWSGDCRLTWAASAEFGSAPKMSDCSSQLMRTCTPMACLACARRATSAASAESSSRGRSHAWRSAAICTEALYPSALTKRCVLTKTERPWTTLTRRIGCVPSWLSYSVQAAVGQRAGRASSARKLGWAAKSSSYRAVHSRSGSHTTAYR
mmetsp:Transcript_35699/g.89003  ORF Transcript_35699/g.89003 Transcript_35699/m.89003 type:complete len:235 (-) Transcript_35699:2274-2978(-)